MVPVRARALRKAAVAAGIICAIALALGLVLVRRGGERAVAPTGEEREQTGTIAVAPAESPPEHRTAFEDTVAEDAPPLELRGTLILIDAEGAEHPEEDGEFRILRPVSGEEPVPVAVTRGKWRAVWPEPTFPTELHLMAIQAGGVEAEVEGHLPVDASGEVAIRARWLPPAPVLEVVGKDTGAGLRGVDVLLGSYVEPGALHVMAASPHSGGYGPELTIVESQDSPIVLEKSQENARRLQGQRSVWARAPGYAWGSIDIDFSHGGPHILALEREATLEVTILSRTAPGTEEGPAVLRIRRAPESEEVKDLEEIDKFLAEIASQEEAKQILDEQISSIRKTRERIEGGCEGEPVASVAAKHGGVARIEGLPPGRLAVCVELGSSLADPYVLGSALAELRAGETGRVTITLADPEPSVPFEGRVELPPEWGSVEVVYVELLHEGEGSRARAWKSVPAFPAGPGTFGWDAGNVSPGRYQVLLSDFALVRTFDVPPEGKRDALIRVGNPVEVRVKLLDAATGEAVEDSHVAYGPVRPIEGANVPRQIAEVEDSSWEHVFRAPAGRIRIEANSDGYMSGEETLDLSRGTKRVVLRMARGCGTVLTLDGIIPPEPPRLLRDIRLEPLEGTGRIVRVEWLRHDTASLTVDSPGLYELRVPRVEGLAPVEPVRIQIPPDRYVEQTITLRRE
jgi:hypothetical protein